MNSKLGPVLVALGLTTAAPSYAQALIDVTKLKDAMEDAVVKRENATTPKLKGEANIVEFKITDVRINGQKPALSSYWMVEQLVPVFVCPGLQKKTYTETRSITSHSEVTLTETTGLKATVDVSVKGSAGAVEGTVAAGFEASVEKGTTKTNGTELAAVTGQSWEILPGTGEWVGGVGERYKYDNAEYEVDVEVTKATFRNPVILGWLPKEYSGKKALKLTAKGRFSASIIEGGIEVNSTPMSKQEFDDHCKGGDGGRPTNLGLKAVSVVDPIDNALKRIKR